MKSKSLILMIVSLGFGLVAAVGISQVMGRGGTIEQPKISLGPVLVSVEQLEHSNELDETNVKLENWPVEIIPENAATSFAQVENMAIVTRLSKGLPILLTDLVDKNSVKELVIPPGFKVVAIPVSADDTFAGLLTPGDKVDVIGIFKVRRKNEMRTTSKTFLKAITVFSVGNQMRSDLKREGGNGSAIVGVLLNEKQTEQIVLVQKEAQLKLVLRGKDADEEESDGSLVEIFDDGEDENGEGQHENSSQYQSASYGGDSNGWTTRIWNGGDVETFRYNALGALPESEERVSFGPPQTSRFSRDDKDDEESNSEDNEDYEQSSDSDRSLEEDQYPDE